jgi:N6-L-threonylcarbamoyladenine synthase
MLVLMKNFGKFKTIGETRDDAAGEAFDKAAQLLKLGYPGGPAIAAEAAKFSIFPGLDKRSRAGNFQFPIFNNQKKSKIQNPNFKNNIKLPRPMINDKSYDFSFSGLKTALLYQIKKDSEWKKRVPEYAYEFQQAVIDVLVAKTIKAAKEFKVKTVMLAGGVSANKELREQMEQAVKEKLEKVEFSLPELKYCTDNAAMTAAAGYFRAQEKKFTPWQKIKVDCNLELK